MCSRPLGPLAGELPGSLEFRLRPGNQYVQQGECRAPRDGQSFRGDCDVLPQGEVNQAVEAAGSCLGRKHAGLDKCFWISVSNSLGPLHPSLRTVLEKHTSTSDIPDTLYYRVVWSWTLLHCPSYPACPGSWYLQEAPVRGAYWEDQSDSSSGFSLVAETPAPWPLGPVPALPLTSDPALLSHTVSLSVWLSLTSFFFWESELQFISFVGFHKGAV